MNPIFDVDALGQPDCAFCEPGGNETIPVDRVIAKADEYFAKNDMPGVKRHLTYWLAEARALGDRRGELAVLDELIGACRMMGLREEGLRAVDEALSLTEALSLADTVTGATVCLNAGTAYKAFGMDDKAVAMYRLARPIYEKYLNPDDSRIAGLCNNMAIALTAVGQTDEAERLFRRAAAIKERDDAGKPDAAVSWLNLADLIAGRDGLEDGAEQIEACLEKAQALLTDPAVPRDSYYAFVAGKCAPVFTYYGWFAFGGELKELSEAIYDGNRAE